MVTAPSSRALSCHLSITYNLSHYRTEAPVSGKGKLVLKLGGFIVLGSMILTLLGENLLMWSHTRGARKCHLSEVSWPWMKDRMDFGGAPVLFPGL